MFAVDKLLRDECAILLVSLGNVAAMRTSVLVVVLLDVVLELVGQLVVICRFADDVGILGRFVYNLITAFCDRLLQSLFARAHRGTGVFGLLADVGELALEGRFNEADVSDALTLLATTADHKDRKGYV